MTLDRLSQITEVGIKSGITLNGINVIGVVTATSLTVNGGAVVNGVVTATSFSGNVTGNITPTGLVVSGVSTFQSSSFWGDGDIAYFGDGQDLLIWHNSTDSIIRDNGTGDLNIEGGNRIKLTNPTGIETYAVFNQDGASELWYDNVKRLETTGAGVSITGSVTATGLSTFSSGIQVGATTSIVVGDTFIRNNSIGLGATTTTGRNAGVGTAAGTLIFNTTTGSIEYYTGTSWGALKAFDATGGTITIANGRKIHTFTGSGTFTVNVGGADVEYLVVAGGGGGGSAGNPGYYETGAGGGAGGFRTGSLPVIPGSYSVTIGAGGAGGASPVNTSKGNPGADSIFSTITSTGGGGGGGGYAPSPSGGGGGLPGGSGGGRAGQSPPASAGTGNSPPTSPPQGNPGGTSGIGGNENNGAGGGGGAGGAGSPNPGTTTGGNGGPGASSSISGASITYAGGGGGSGGTPGSGGPGGGGPGVHNGTGISGGVGSGGGGGGNSGTPAAPGGQGGSGIVIIAYPI